MRDHRNLEAWKEAKELARISVRLSHDHWKPHAAAVLGQLQRSALSIQLNIAEGYALKSRASFSNHLRIAYGSGAETEELLELAMEEHLVPIEICTAAIARCRRCQRLLLGLIQYCRRTG